MILCRLLVCSALVALGAQAVPISNNVSGVGNWTVDIGQAGSSTNGVLTYAPGQSTDLIYGFGNYYRTNSSGAYSALSGSDPTVIGPNRVQSTGSITGQNGAIGVTVTSYIDAGSPILWTKVDFSSVNPFGYLELANYLDEDVLGAGGDNVVFFGTPGTNSFQLLTVDGAQQIGVAHAADVNAVNATYLGYGVHTCCGNFSVGVNGPVVNDPRYPGQTARGPMDGTSNFNFLLDANATSASLLFGLGGSPQGQPVEIPSDTPEPATMLLSGAALLGAAGLRRFRR